MEVDKVVRATKARVTMDNKEEATTTMVETVNKARTEVVVAGTRDAALT